MQSFQMTIADVNAAVAALLVAETWVRSNAAEVEELEGFDGSMASYK